MRGQDGITAGTDSRPGKKSNDITKSRMRRWKVIDKEKSDAEYIPSPNNEREIEYRGIRIYWEKIV